MAVALAQSSGGPVELDLDLVVDDADLNRRAWAISASSNGSIKERIGRRGQLRVEQPVGARRLIKVAPEPGETR
ncbi:hypothetical protein T190_00485 [Sinorhizobium meliloti CCBAU 01290]|nr:hypothetical protein T190_00485 [Sinorhizobium meliloti CCBAU 01290]